MGKNVITICAIQEWILYEKKSEYQTESMIRRVLILCTASLSYKYLIHNTVWFRISYGPIDGYFRFQL